MKAKELAFVLISLLILPFTSLSQTDKINLIIQNYRKAIGGSYIDNLQSYALTGKKSYSKTALTKKQATQ